jgi:3',5'-cyclic AMP phosphodiesterase CpdA
MKKEIIQIENISAEEFKDEIIKGVLLALKDLILPFTDPDEEKLLTRHETAKILAISLVTLYYWGKKNLLQSYRISNLVRYKKTDIYKALIKRKF